jgi:hypothetical protein
MVEELKNITEKLILENDNNSKEKDKYLLIRKILNQKEAFLNMNIEYAYAILRDLKIPEDNIKNTYIKLLDEIEKQF